MFDGRCKFGRRREASLGALAKFIAFARERPMGCVRNDEDEFFSWSIYLPCGRDSLHDRLRRE